VVRNRFRGGLEPPDPVVIVGLLAATFRSGMASGAFSTFAYAAPDLPLLVQLDSVVVVVFLAAIFESGVGVVAFSASAYAALDPPPPSEPRTCPLT
jgi:hypothetical protein